MAAEDEALSGELVDETARLDLDELCALCGMKADHVVEMVEAGIIRPEGDRQTVWRFSTVAEVIEKSGDGPSPGFRQFAWARMTQGSSQTS